MKKLLVLVALLALCLIDSASSEHKPRKHKKVSHHLGKDSEDEFGVQEKELELRKKEEALRIAELEREVELGKEKLERLESEFENENTGSLFDPCSKVHCGAGRVCEVNDEGYPKCVCIPTCPVEKDPRRKVCTNHNETWGSDCSVYQHRCWCDTKNELCKGSHYKHVHIEYYGVCRDMPECTTEEMSDFPRRMRDWLFNIMRDLADRQELTHHYMKLEKEAEFNLTKRWTNAAIWKWCDLDGHPHDRSISRHELFPIRAPLMALEHCISPFLDGCDSDNDHRISLKEWATCLELDQDEVEDRCEEIKEYD